MKITLIKTIALLTFVLTNCNTMKPVSENKLQTKAPFTITKALYIINNNKLYNTIKITKTNSEIELNEIFFLGRKLKLNKENNIYTAKVTKTEFRNDMVLHSDPKKEYGNTPPVVEKIPFNLKNNEAVVSYTIEGIIKFYKIKITNK